MKSRSPSSRRHAVVLGVERFEARFLLSTFTVTNTLDDGSNGSLRWAIGQADTATSPSTIDFSLGAAPTTIALSQGQLELSNSAYAVTITGPATGLTISGGGTSRVFQVDSGVTATLSGLTISGGSTSENGGGLYNDGGTTTLTDCTVSGNSASTQGGGLDNQTNPGAINLNDCTISGNSAGGKGGGLYSSGGTATLTDCTVSGNSASNGGGMDDASGTVTVEDTIVAEDAATTSGPDALGTLDSQGNNLIGESDGSSGWVGSDLTGTIAMPINPLLAPLGDYGGPTPTMALLPGSPAIGMGTAVGEMTTDQRGEPLDSPTPDIGAFQSQGFTLMADAGSNPQAGVIGDPFANPLAVTVTANNPVEPVAGGVVSFSVNPAQSGASASLSGIPAIIGSNGVAQVDATANHTAGTYAVVAGVGAASPVDFTLTNNLIPLTFSGVVDSTITYGTASVTFSGTLANGSQAPVGEVVAITLDGVTQLAGIDTSGAFSNIFDTASLSASGSPSTVSYSYTSDGTFASASTTSTLTINQATPTITWANPADITYGPALGPAQLDATASVAGTFSYTPAAGTVLGAGNNQELAVTFTPTDTTDYSIATATATINVDKATPTITWANPADIIYGTALSGAQLDATASSIVNGADVSVEGIFIYSPASGAVLSGPSATDQEGRNVSPGDGADPGHHINRG
ncbi:MAG: choice-of-anchor Q domain-containing protein [Isosphaeraceae bacterium]